MIWGGTKNFFFVSFWPSLGPNFWDILMAVLYIRRGASNRRGGSDKILKMLQEGGLDRRGGSKTFHRFIIGG